MAGYNTMFQHLRKNIGTIGDVVIGQKLKEQANRDAVKQAIEIAIGTQKAKADYPSAEDTSRSKYYDAMSKYYEKGGQGLYFYDDQGNTYDSQGNPVSGADITPGKGTKLLKIVPGTTKPAKEMTADDLKNVQKMTGAEAVNEVPYLKGIPGMLERFMPFGGMVRKRTIENRATEKLAPYTTQYGKQFLPQGRTPAPVSEVSGRFTGGVPAQPATVQVPPEIAAEYPDAYQGEDGQWYVDQKDQTGQVKTYRLRIE